MHLLSALIAYSVSGLLYGISQLFRTGYSFTTSTCSKSLPCACSAYNMTTCTTLFGFSRAKLLIMVSALVTPPLWWYNECIGIKISSIFTYAFPTERRGYDAHHGLVSAMTTTVTVCHYQDLQVLDHPLVLVLNSGRCTLKIVLSFSQYLSVHSINPARPVFLATKFLLILSTHVYLSGTIMEGSDMLPFFFGYHLTASSANERTPFLHPWNILLQIRGRIHG